MSDPGKSGGDEGGKREIFRPGDSLLDISKDADDRAEAAARAARKVIEERERQKQIEDLRRLGPLGRFWRRVKEWFKKAGSVALRPLRGLSPASSGVIGRIAGVWQRAIWPVASAITHKTDAQGRLRLTLAGKFIIFAAALLVAWPVFKMYYVLGTTREFRGVDITFKQIITHERYLVFGNYRNEKTGETEEMAFNVTDSWVYWNWTPDLMFAQVPVVGTCDFQTYGWYLRVPRFVPFVGRTLLAEPIIIATSCKTLEGLPTGPRDQ